jgi:phthiocerol/phenolphthiocerol synthesis type-I polyketide synthase E
LSEVNSYDIAVIGMAGRFPGADSPAEFWENIRSGRNCITYFQEDELRRNGVSERMLTDSNYVCAAPVLRDIERFDAHFFAVTPREAELMDPQQRLFLECCWEALEDAGYDPFTYPERVGVFGGARTNTYLASLLTHRDLLDAVGMFHLGLANDLGFLTTRVSHFLNLRGPSCSLHTACSTSLIAVHLACQSLLLDECHIALAGGVAVNVPHRVGYKYEEGSVESPDGYCRAFDLRARGTIFGSGIGLVVLKRLQDALDDGDSIHAVIRGSAMNNDGSAKASFTAPGIQGQIAVVKEALRNAQVSPRSIGYVECHATGTLLGDAIEVRALTKAMGQGQANTCALGSVKSNIGHLDAAAGIAGLIKTVFCLKNRMLPPSLHFEEPNPQIEFSGTPFYVNRALRPWTSQDGEPLRAGVSAFGVGGTNAHVIVEESPQALAHAPGRRWQLLPLSARSEKALGNIAARLAAHLKQHTKDSLADVAYTLQVGRRRFDRRGSVVCSTIEDASDLLEQFATEAERRDGSEGVEEAAPRVAFMFPGQGAQYAGMGRELYREEKIFRRHVDECSEILRPHIGVELSQVLYREDQQAGDQTRDLEQTWIVQPALVVVEYALAQLWRSWGIHPDILIGHSVGEYAAACISGVMTQEEMLKLVAARGRLMQQGKAGGMMAVAQGPQQLAGLLASTGLELAAVNAPGSCTVAGTEDQISEMEKRLSELGVSCQRLRTSHAFHSRLLDHLLAEYREEVNKVALKSPQIPFIANVTGQRIKELEAKDPSYWVRQMREPVQFESGVREMAQARNRAFLEVGPGQTLRRLVLRQPQENRGRLQLASMAASGDEQRSMMAALGRLWENGAGVDWKSFQQEKRRRVSLPTYPFERKRYWIDPVDTRSLPSIDQSGSGASAGISPEPDEWFWIPSWKLTATPGDAEQAADAWLVFLDDHGVGSEICACLEAKGLHVIRVRRGASFQAGIGDTFFLNPREAGDYTALTTAIHESGKQISHVVHLWSFDPEHNFGSEGPISSAGLDTVLYAVQSIIRQTNEKKCKVNIVSTGMLQVESGDCPRPEKAGILAFGTVVPLEHSNVECCCIDIAAPNSEGEIRKLAVRLVRELRSTAGDAVVAYRSGNRWAPCYERIRLDHQPPWRSMHEGSVYLILGGLGGVGLVIAEQLARRAKSKFVLAARSPLPPREQWQELLQTTTDKTIAYRLRTILEIESTGSEIETIAADIAERHPLQRVLEFTSGRFGRIDGVIHAAGPTRDRSALCPVLNTTMETFALQAKPKLQGIELLRELLHGRNVQFVLLISSNATALGGVGFLAYTAANLYMDAYALQQFRRDDETAWICSNWDHWPEIEARREQFDLQFDETAVIKALERKHLYAMTKEEAQQGVAKILDSFESGVVYVSKGDFAYRVGRGPKPKPVASNLGDVSTDAREKNPRPNIKSVYVAPRSDVERKIAKIWAQFLGIEKVGIHDDFFELGGHSLLATKLIPAIRTAVGTDLPLAKFFAAPTIAKIAESVATPAEPSIRI